MSKIFKNPMVKEVIFEIQFNNLLFIDKKIGDYQLKIMREFPESSELIQKHVMFAVAGGSDIKKDDFSNDNMPFQKIWQFSSEKAYVLRIASNSLSIVSKLHKTYDSHTCENRFKDIIKTSVSAFLDNEIAPIPLIKRIGLRYINDGCVLPSDLNSTSYSSYYNTAFNFDKFDIANAKNMQFLSVTKNVDEVFLRYVENYNENKLSIDFDAYKYNINPNDYLGITDKLHTVISEAWENTIKLPVKECMG